MKVAEGDLLFSFNIIVTDNTMHEAPKATACVQVQVQAGFAKGYKEVRRGDTVSQHVCPLVCALKWS